MMHFQHDSPKTPHNFVIEDSVLELASAPNPATKDKRGALDRAYELYLNLLELEDGGVGRLAGCLKVSANKTRNGDVNVSAHKLRCSHTKRQ